MLAWLLHEPRLVFLSLLGILLFTGRVLAVRERMGAGEQAVALGEYAIVEKTCGGCGEPVGNDARAGKRCPHCGARWTVEHISEH
ncbi:hypothetical protein JXO52_05575 [bacterium]|nr:hypothetical protein [bacterium]